LLDLARESELRFSLAESLLGPPALEELTDIATDTEHHFEEFLVRLSDVPAEKLHDAEKIHPVLDGKTASPVQPLLGGNLRPGEVGIAGYVGDLTDRGAAAATTNREALCGLDRRGS
jgi:hypothetical protein